MSKMKDVIEFAQIIIINVQQEQEYQTNYHYWKSFQLYVDDKVWLAIGKQYSIKRPNWKLNYKNQKYTVTEIVSSHAVHLNIENVYFIFYVNWLCFTADNFLLSQSQFDNQSTSIHVKGEKKWYVDEIIAEKLCYHNCNVIKWFQVKYIDYTVLK